MQLFIALTISRDNDNNKISNNSFKNNLINNLSSREDKSADQLLAQEKPDMASTAIDVNQGITGQQTATIRNYNTQPRLSKFLKVNIDSLKTKIFILSIQNCYWCQRSSCYFG